MRFGRQIRFGLRCDQGYRHSLVVVAGLIGNRRALQVAGPPASHKLLFETCRLNSKFGRSDYRHLVKDDRLPRAFALSLSIVLGTN